MAKILIIASNYGLWAEELQAPWDALKQAGHELTLATFLGKTPLPFKLSMDPEFIDPMLNIPMNPPELLTRVNEILDNGEWANTIKISDAKMADYDYLVLVGGPGAAVCANPGDLRHLSRPGRGGSLTTEAVARHGDAIRPRPHPVARRRPARRRYPGRIRRPP
jgi:putative intracellular protease/amidase